MSLVVPGALQTEERGARHICRRSSCVLLPVVRRVHSVPAAGVIKPVWTLRHMSASSPCGSQASDGQCDRGSQPTKSLHLFSCWGGSFLLTAICQGYTTLSPPEHCGSEKLYCRTSCPDISSVLLRVDSVPGAVLNTGFLVVNQMYKNPCLCGA